MIPLCLPLGVSLSGQTMYLIECAPKRLRGMVGVTVATFISTGKLSGQLLGIRWGSQRHRYCGQVRGQVVVGSNDSQHVGKAVASGPMVFNIFSVINIKSIYCAFS